MSATINNGTSSSIETNSMIPILSSEEVRTKQNPLGQGGFCSVSAVHSFHFSRSTSGNNHNEFDEQKEVKRAFSKQFDNYKQKHYSYHNIRLPSQGPIAAHPSLQKPPKVALKRVKPTLKAEKFDIGMKDLINEVLILSKCSHPNIITLYAVGCDDNNENDTLTSTLSTLIQSNHLNFAIIDQLKCTLKNKFYQWKNDSNIILPQSRKAFHDSWLERLVVMIKIADAIHYLHQNHIMHRDIHPDNIGFSFENDVVKLFDFGLATSVTSSEKRNTDNGSVENNDNGGIHNNLNEHVEDDDDNELFDLTGDTGTLRYMAPEVALGSPYGFKADVYSFGLVLHEALSLSKPFLRVQPNNFHTEVIRGGLRPTIDDNWPMAIRNLITRMWSNDIATRPTSKEVRIILGDLLRSGNDNDLFPKYWIDGWKKNLTSSIKSLKSISSYK
jgi:serine/threonine protein kinase